MPDLLVIRKDFVHITGSYWAGALLSQIVYWFTPSKSGKSKLRVKRGDRMLLAKTREEMAADCLMTFDQYKRAIKKLRDLGLVTTEQHIFAGKAMSHFWLDNAKLSDMMQPTGAPCTTHVVCNAPPMRCISAPLITETTTETTTEQKHERLATRASETLEEGAEAMRELTQRVEEAPRKIDNWVADRPGLAEQKLRTRFTALEWMMKANEILALHRSKMTPAATRLTANSLAMAWKQMYSRKYEGFVKEFTHKEMGQMKMVLKGAGDNAPRLIEFVLSQWGDFTYEARLRKGIPMPPDRPTIGFVLQHYDVAMQLIAEKPEPVTVDTEVVTSHTPIVAKVPIVVEDVATIEDVMAAIASFGQKK